MIYQWELVWHSLGLVLLSFVRNLLREAVNTKLFHSHDRRIHGVGFVSYGSYPCFTLAHKPIQMLRKRFHQFHLCSEWLAYMRLYIFTLRHIRFDIWSIPHGNSFKRCSYFFCVCCHSKLTELFTIYVSWNYGLNTKLRKLCYSGFFGGTWRARLTALFSVNADEWINSCTNMHRTYFTIWFLVTVCPPRTVCVQRDWRAALAAFCVDEQRYIFWGKLFCNSSYSFNIFLKTGVSNHT